MEEVLSYLKILYTYFIETKYKNRSISNNNLILTSNYNYFVINKLIKKKLLIKKQLGLVINVVL